ncbi:MAG: hypothetical protein VKL41_06480 [Snowella sp.]|nr:hypothetical protein [Snowella sp.]
MSTRFKFFLINCLSRYRFSRDSGFALPMAIMVGGCIMIVGLAVVIQAQGNQSKVVSQKANAVANAAAESGLTNVQNFLNNNSFLAKYNMSDWKNAVALYDNDNTTTATDATKAADMMTQVVSDAKQLSCTYAPQSNETVRANLITAMGSMTGSTPQTFANDPNSSSYTLRNYSFSGGNAQVILAATTGSGGSGSSANAYLKAKFPVMSGPLAAPTSNFPGLWVKEYLRAGQNDNNPGTLDANVAYDCGINAGTLATSAGNGSSAGYTNYVSANNASGGKAIRVALAPGNTIEKSTVPMPNPPTSAPSGVTPVNIGAVTGSLTLPRTTANASPNNVNDTTSSANYSSSSGTYYYTISSISGNGVNLQFTRGAKVVVFLTGNITIGGKSQITHNCLSTANSLACDATDVQIIGAMKNGSAINNATFATTGNSAVCSIFFWAPTYTVDMSGGGNAGDCPAMNGTNYANQNGIYWVRAWIGGGQGSHQALNQTGSNWNILRAAVTIPVKNQLGSTTEFAMVDNTAADSLAASSATPATVDTSSATPANTSGQCTVPNLTGRTLTDVNSFAGVTADIVGVGLKAGTATRTDSSTSSISTTQITSQSPAAGTSVDCNTMVSYSYSLKNAAFPIPNLVGTTTATISGNGRNARTTVSLTNAQAVITGYQSGCFLVGKETGNDLWKNNNQTSLSVTSQSATLSDGSVLSFTNNTAASPPKYVTCGFPIDYSYNY